MAVTLVADLGFGDAGKGSVVDYLSRSLPRVHTVVRYNGGPQAAHNVVTSDGREHTFSQFGSGTLAGDITTYISRFMLVNPLNMITEASFLEKLGISDPLHLIVIEDKAVVITPFQKSANRLLELSRGAERHGSCGEGVGETRADELNGYPVLLAGDLSDKRLVRNKLETLKQLKFEELKEIDFHLTPSLQQEYITFVDPQLIDALVELYYTFATKVKIVSGDFLGTALLWPGNVVFEGAQGVLIDEKYGFHPYTTWANTTFENADQLLADFSYTRKVTRIGLLRSYAVRHGPGPFPTEDLAMTASIPETHNQTNKWQREMRMGHFDAVLARYALNVVGGVDYLGITCMDRVGDGTISNGLYDKRSVPHTNFYYDLPIPQTIQDQEKLTTLLSNSKPWSVSYYGNAFIEGVEDRLATKVGLLSYGPTAEDKKERILV